MTVISSHEDDLTDDERRQLESILIRFRVRTVPFLSLMTYRQARSHVLLTGQIEDVNGLILEKIEVVDVAQ